MQDEGEERASERQRGLAVICCESPSPPLQRDGAQSNAFLGSSRRAQQLANALPPRTKCHSDRNFRAKCHSDRNFRAHKQKEQRNRKEKRRLHPVEAQTNAQNRGMVLSSGPPRSWPARSVRPMFNRGERERWERREG